MRRYDVAIIGAGTAGLSARREVAKLTDNYTVIDSGPLGTTCIRVGCMPSKALIQVANDYHRRLKLKEQGIHGGRDLTVKTSEVMAHVRKLRDRFLAAMTADMDEWTPTHLLRGKACFLTENELQVGDDRIYADKVIIATGSRPIVPQAWSKVSDLLIDTDDFFSLTDLPRSLAVIGLGVIGIELGQALSRLGVSVHGITLDRAIGGLTDPKLQDCAFDIFRGEFPITLGAADKLERENDRLIITAGDQRVEVEKAFVAMGRKPNLDHLGLAKLDLPRDQKGDIIFDRGTYRIPGTSLFLTGDANGERPILHEAADEGRIAGYNAGRSDDQCFQRRTKLGITFSSPNIATVGESFRDLNERKVDFVTGEVSYEGQGRAIIQLKEKGRLHVYVDKQAGTILGAEMLAPSGEHLAHLLAWAIAAGIDVHQALSLPFYHPVIEEGLRTALRNAAALAQTKTTNLETLRCQDPPVGSWG